MNKNFLSCLFILTTTSLVPVFAATLGTDNASVSPAYDSWVNGDDGFVTGDGAFGSWALTNSGSNSGRFVGNSTSLAAGNTGGNINSAGEAFGLFGHTGENSIAERSFDSDLSVGQTFSIQLAVNFRDGSKGFALKDGGAGGSEIFLFTISSAGYVVSNATTGNGNTGAYDSNTVFTLSFTQTALNSGTWNIARSGGLTDSDSGTYTGSPDRLRLFIFNETNNANERNLFANNLSIVPEPSTLGLLGLAGFGALRLFRRRR